MSLALAITASVLAIGCFILWWQCRVRLTEARKYVQYLQREKQVFFEFTNDIGTAFSEDFNQEKLPGMILDGVMRVTTASSGAIYLRQGSPGQLQASIVKGMFPPPCPLTPDNLARAAMGMEPLHEVLKKTPLPLDNPTGLAAVFRAGDTVLLAGEEARSLFPPVRDPNLQAESLLLATMQYQGQNLGILALANPIGQNSFTQAELDVVKALAAQAAFTLHHTALYRQLAEKKQLDRDLVVAREIQQILLPVRCPEIAGYDLAAVNLPAKYVSGDYFDFIQVDEHRWGMVIADVSGKGVPASLVMAMCRSVLRTQALGCLSAAELLRRVNRILFPDLRNDMFITAAYAILDTHKHELTVAKAGHDAPLFRQSDNGNIRLLQSPGMVLGIDSGDVFDMVIQDLVVPMQPNDMLLMYTDGVNEAVDEEGREFGRDPLQEALRKSTSDGASALTVNIVERVARFRGAAQQSDDITLLSLQRK